MPGNLDLEASDLKTHVVVCAERYNEISRRLQSLEKWNKAAVVLIGTGVLTFSLNAIATHIN